MPAPELSLVVATRNRAGRLPRTLESFAAMESDRAWELVVVDNGSTDETRGIVEAFAASAAIPVEYVFEPEPGLGRARNAGIGASRGEIVATMDDDCYPRPDYVDVVLGVFETHDVDFIGGRVLLHDESDVAVSILDREVVQHLPPDTFPYPGFIGGANHAFRREVFRDIGGFDPDLGAGTPFPCEDADFCARASVRGWRGGYFPEATVFHHHGRKTEAEAEAVRRSYAAARGAYYAKVLLDAPSLRRQCLKWWYWSLSSLPTSHTARELLSALRYLGLRLGRRVLRVGAGRRASGVGSG